MTSEEKELVFSIEEAKQDGDSTVVASVWALESESDYPALGLKNSADPLTFTTTPGSDRCGWVSSPATDRQTQLRITSHSGFHQKKLGSSSFREVRAKVVSASHPSQQDKGRDGEPKQ